MMHFSKSDDTAWTPNVTEEQFLSEQTGDMDGGSDTVAPGEADLNVSANDPAQAPRP